MPRSRADEILEEWKLLSHTVAQPAEAPRPRGYRMPLAFGALNLAAIALVVVVGLFIRGGGLSPHGSQVGGGVTNPGPTASDRPSPSVTPSQPVSPSPSPDAAQGPSDDDVTAARDVVDQYTSDLVRGDYPAAWALLGPEEQSRWGSLANFKSDRRPYFDSVGGRFEVKTEPSDLPPVAEWVAGANGAQIDLRHAVLVEVDYPALAASNAYDVYIVNPSTSGPRLYSVR
jgi:hypothetical protein